MQVVRERFWQEGHLDDVSREKSDDDTDAAVRRGHEEPPGHCIGTQQRLGMPCGTHHHHQPPVVAALTTHAWLGRPPCYCLRRPPDVVHASFRCHRRHPRRPARINLSRRRSGLPPPPGASSWRPISSHPHHLPPPTARITPSPAATSTPAAALPRNRTPPSAAWGSPSRTGEAGSRWERAGYGSYTAASTSVLPYPRSHTSPAAHGRVSRRGGRIW